MVASYATPASASSDRSGAVSTVSGGSGAVESNESPNRSHANKGTNGSPNESPNESYANKDTNGSPNGSHANKDTNGSSRSPPVLDAYRRPRDVMSCDAVQAGEKLNSEGPMSLGGGVGGRGAMIMCKYVDNGVRIEGNDMNRSGAGGSPTIPVDPSRSNLAATEKQRSTLSSPSLLLLPPPPPAQSQPPVGPTRGSSTNPEASAAGPIPARSLDLETAAAFSALEKLKNGVKAANDTTVAPYSIEKCGESYSVSASDSFSSFTSAAARGRGGVSSSALSQQGVDEGRVTSSGIEKKTRLDDGALEGEKRVGEVGKLSEVDMLSALAPLLEEIVGRQRREWDMQVSASGI